MYRGDMAIPLWYDVVDDDGEVIGRELEHDEAFALARAHARVDRVAVVWAVGRSADVNGRCTWRVGHV